jgi:hypothetical protein
VTWHFEISEATPEEVADWLAYTSVTELASVVRINDTPYYLTHHRFGWEETPYGVVLVVWGPAPLKRQLTPWSIQCEIGEGSTGAEVMVRCNAGDDLLEQANLLMSMVKEKWPGISVRQSAVMRPDDDPDEAVGEYFKGSGRMFVDWLKEVLEKSQSLIDVPNDRRLQLCAPRHVHTDRKETVMIDVEILEPAHADEDGTLIRCDFCPGAVTFNVASYEQHDGDTFRVKAACHDPYRSNCEAVRALRDMVGKGEVDDWPMVDPMPLVAFFDGLWEKIQATWQRPERGVPETMDEDPIPESEAGAERSQEGMDKSRSEIEEGSSKPWELIPEHRWDRTAVEMWCEGYFAQEIANRVNVTAKTVHNRLSKLRQLYPDADIPLNNER